MAHTAIRTYQNLKSTHLNAVCVGPMCAGVGPWSCHHVFPKLASATISCCFFLQHCGKVNASND